MHRKGRLQGDLSCLPFCLLTRAEFSFLRARTDHPCTRLPEPQTITKFDFSDGIWKAVRGHELAVDALSSPDPAHGFNTA